MSAESIATLRQKFEDEVSENPSLYHQVDIERVRTEEWQVKRYLLAKKNNEAEAFDAMIKALQWKQSIGLHERTDQSFPYELYTLNCVEVNGRDNQGRLIQWEAFRNQRVFKEISDLIKQFLAHCLERVDRLCGESGFVLVIDVNGAGVSNIDLNLIKYKLAINEHYPLALQAMYIVDVPWILNPIMKIVLSFMSEEIRNLVQFAKRADLLKTISAEHIPKSLSGQREKQSVPANVMPLDQMMNQWQLDEKFVDYFYNYYKLQRTNK